MGSISSNSLEAGKQKHTLGVLTANLPAAVTKTTKFVSKTRVQGNFSLNTAWKIIPFYQFPAAQVSCEHLPQIRTSQMPGDPRSRGLSSLPSSRDTGPLSWPCNSGKIILESQYS